MLDGLLVAAIEHLEWEPASAAVEGAHSPWPTSSTSVEESSKNWPRREEDCPQNTENALLGSASPMWIFSRSRSPDDLSFGVDMKKIRWCGILQVQYIRQKEEKLPPPFHLSRLGGLIVFVIYMITTCICPGLELSLPQ
ncbi:uncharacterized protein LOC133924720 [Phragmites australis]|uniref:uncharacterized protein LOC133924720 n=1 Tax=Phragmites australis TaxID=29695 RepID=UPI002D76E154|nr:uncharacterized protein LOC133924720 [Phragmites australis]